jgi:enoyl-CoA hydratase/carnithine racemase
MPDPASPNRDPDGQITVEVQGPILRIRIDRREKYNGFTPRMLAELGDAAAPGRGPDLWVGALLPEPHFTAGLDLPRFPRGMKEGARRRGRGPIRWIRRARARLPQTIVAAVHGITYTLGIG